MHVHVPRASNLKLDLLLYRYDAQVGGHSYD